MGTLVESVLVFSARNGMNHQFAQKWEADHPACNALENTLRYAVGAVLVAHRGGKTDGECWTAFVQALGQEPREDDPRQAAYLRAGGIGQEPQEDAGADIAQLVAERDLARADRDVKTSERNEALERIERMESEIEENLAAAYRQRNEARARNSCWADKHAAEVSARVAAEAEVERLKAHPFPDEAVRAIAEAGICAVFADPMMPEGLSQQSVAAGVEAALAEAAKWGTHGTWVPFEEGDRVKSSGPGSVVGKVLGIRLGVIVQGKVENWGVECATPLRPEPEPTKCGCGACTLETVDVCRVWMLRDNTDQLAVMNFCPECGEKLTDPAGGEEVRDGAE